jgi:anti-sigma factor ChrR (cupin superfamily)
MKGMRLLFSGLLGSGSDYDRFDWQPFRPGVCMARLYQEGESGPSAALLRYEPGSSVPQHLHRGIEHIFVLDGWQEDEQGRYERGSLLIHGGGTSHRVASPDGCVVLAIWERPVEIL